MHTSLLSIFSWGDLLLLNQASRQPGSNVGSDITNGAHVANLDSTLHYLPESLLFPIEVKPRSRCPDVKHVQEWREGSGDG